MEQSLISALPNLSIGVIAVLSLVYVTRQFIDQLRTLSMKHMEEIKEREIALRTVEKEVRTTILTALNESTAVMKTITHLYKIEE